MVAEYRLRKPDGTTLWNRSKGSAHLQPDGHIIVFGTTSDITDRKQAEEELLLKNALLSAQQEVSIDGILAVDSDGKVILFNRRFAEMWKIPPELLASKCDDALSRSVRGLLADPRAFLEKTRHLYDHRQETSRDEIALVNGRVLDRYSAPMFGDGGRYFGRVWYFRDITDRILVEQSLRQSEARYRSLVENIDVGITLIDSSHSIVSINRAYARHVAEDSGRTLRQGMFPRIRKTRGRLPQLPGTKAMATGKMAEIEAEAVRDDGSRFSVKIKAFPLFAADGSPSGFIELVEDISRIKQTEDFLKRAKEAAEAANRAKSEFLANMSHEIRTPMTAILGFSDLLASNNLSHDERRQFLEGIRRNGTALLDLINDILDLSKIEAEKIILERAAYPLRPIIDDVLSMVKTSVMKKGLSLVVDYQLAASRDHPYGPHAPPPDPREFGEQRGQVHRSRRSPHRRPLPARRRRSRPHAVCGLGHRHRHPHREARHALPAVRAGGRVREPSLRRHGAGAGHLQTPGNGTRRRY